MKSTSRLLTRFSIVSTLLAALFGATGCSSIARKTELSITAKQPGVLTGPNVSRFSYDPEQLIPEKPYYRTDYEDALNTTPTPDYTRARLARDEVTYDILREIDRNYFEFEKNLKEGAAAKDFITDTVVLSLTTVATAVSSSGAKTALSAVATGVMGTELAFDKAVLREKTFEVLLSRMRSARSEQETLIRQKLHNDRATAANANAPVAYSLDELVRDLGFYYHAGTVTNALTLLHADAAATAKSSEEKLNATITKILAK